MSFLTRLISSARIILLSTVKKFVYFSPKTSFFGIEWSCQHHLWLIVGYFMMWKIIIIIYAFSEFHFWNLYYCFSSHPSLHTTVGSNIIRALVIVLAIFFWFDCQFLSFYACYKQNKAYRSWLDKHFFYNTALDMRFRTEIISNAHIILLPTIFNEVYIHSQSFSCLTV